MPSSANPHIRHFERLKRQWGKYDLGTYADPADLARLPLTDFVVTLDPRARRPLHLKPLVSMLDEAIRPRRSQALRWFSVPVRHWKSTTLRHAIVRHLCRWPDRGVLLCSHTQTFASKQSRHVRKLAAAAGLEFSEEADRQEEWEIKGRDGGLVARGVGGEFTGRGFRLIVVDDPIKSREEAESALIRQRTWDWIQDDVLTRLDPDGTLVLVHSRWHPDDPIGRVRRAESRLRDADAADAEAVRTQRWSGQNIPAISETSRGEERALLPDVWGLDHLREVRASNANKFASLYQGEPRSRDGTIFREPTYYKELPASYRCGYGVDFAYTAKTKADWSVAIRLLVSDERDERSGKVVPVFYVADVVRMQCDSPKFASVLEGMLRERRGPMLWIGSGTEKGTWQFAKQKVPTLQFRNASTDKVVRSERASELWNLGRIRLPDPSKIKVSWLEDVIDEVCAFTGDPGAHDDVVDALASGVAALRGSSMAEALTSFAGRLREGGDGWAPRAVGQR